MKSLLFVLTLVAGNLLANDKISGQIKNIKTFSQEEGVESQIRFAKGVDIRAKSSLKASYLRILNNLSSKISDREKDKKLEIVLELVKNYEDKEISGLFELYLSSEGPILEAISASIWKKSVKEKELSEQGQEFLDLVKEKIVEADESTVSDAISTYFLLESCLQLAVNDDAVSKLYFLMSFPEETADIDDEGNLVESFEFTAFSFLSDYFSEDFEAGFVANMINKTIFVGSKATLEIPMRRDVITLMQSSSPQLDASLENKSNNPVKFYILSQGKVTSNHMLMPGSSHGFMFSSLNSSYRIRLEDGRQYDLKPYKKYHFE